jgi:hypothetical protein
MIDSLKAVSLPEPGAWDGREPMSPTWQSQSTL